MTANIFEEHLAELRRLYVNANLTQRFGVALQRSQLPTCGPNVLIQYVSAIEGCARAVAMMLSGKTKEEAYKELRSLGPISLLRDHICPAMRTIPEELFGDDTWEVFQFATRYRNLLIHECTFLRQDISNRMISATSIVLGVLRENFDPKTKKGMRT